MCVRSSKEKVNVNWWERNYSDVSFYLVALHDPVTWYKITGETRLHSSHLQLLQRLSFQRASLCASHFATPLQRI